MKRNELYEGKVVYRKVKYRGPGGSTTADGPWYVVSTQPYFMSDLHGPQPSLTGNGVLLDYQQDWKESTGQIVSGLGWLVDEDEGLELIENFAAIRRSHYENAQRDVDLQRNYSSAFQALGYENCQVRFKDGRVEIPESLFLDLAKNALPS